MVPREFLPRLRAWFDSRKSWLFPATLKPFDVTTCLRKVNQAFECRSLRRGALQHLATIPGITDATLLLFSGHASVQTLRRYLNFGVRAVHTRLEMMPAAAQLCH
jgi:integrase